MEDEELKYIVPTDPEELRKYIESLSVTDLKKLYLALYEPLANKRLAQKTSAQIKGQERALSRIALDCKEGSKTSYFAQIARGTAEGKRELARIIYQILVGEHRFVQIPSTADGANPFHFQHEEVLSQIQDTKGSSNAALHPHYFVSAMSGETSFQAVFQSIITVFPEGNHAEIEFFSLDAITDSPEKRRPTKVFRHGKVQEVKNIIQVLFQDAKSGEYSLFSMVKGNVDWANASMMHGTFAGMSKDPRPVCGEVFWQRIGTLQTARELIGVHCSPEIQYALLHKKLRVDQYVPQIVSDLEHHTIVAKCRELAGLYEGYFLSQSEQRGLGKAYLHIHPSGKVEMRTPRSGKSVEAGAFYYYPKENFIHIAFDHDFDEKNHFFRYIITLKTERPKSGSEPIILKGTYGGWSKLGKPVAGRVRWRSIGDGSDSIHHFDPIVLPASQIGRFNDDDYGRFMEDTIEYLQGFQDDNYGDDPYQIFRGMPRDLAKQHLGLESPELSSFNGRYEAYILSTFSEAPKYRIQRLAIEIDQLGNLKMKSRHRSDYCGKLMNYNNSNLLFGGITIAGQGAEVLHLNLKKSSGNPEWAITGTYSGIGQIDKQFPVGGRIVLYKVEPDAEVEPQDFDLTNEAIRQSIFAGKYQDMKSFFLGGFDKFIEGYQMFRAARMQPRTNRPERVNYIKGCYMTFRLRQDGTGINIIPMYIDQDGFVHLKSTRPGNPEYFGITYFSDSALNIRYISFGDDDFFAYSVHHYADFFGDELAYLSGVHASKNRVGQAYASREILCRCGQEKDWYEKTNAEFVPIPFGPRHENPEYERFETLNRQYHGVMVFLMGDENNLIKAQREPVTRDVLKLEEFKFTRKISYGNLFFAAAEQYAREGKKELCRDMFIRALKHGFNDRKKFEEESVMYQYRDLFERRRMDEDMEG